MEIDTATQVQRVLSQQLTVFWLERAGHMDAEEADEWRRRIGAWSRFRLAVKTAGSNLGMASRPYVHEVS